MRQGAIDAWSYLQAKLVHLPKDKLYWPDRHYVPLLLTDRNQMFTYEYENSIDLAPSSNLLVELRP